MSETDKTHFNAYTEQYGDDNFQLGDLYIPIHENYGTICLFHGGFWKMPYDRFQLSHLAKALVAIGFAVWNIEYRRTGWVGGGYPGTFSDAVNAVNHLLVLKEKYNSLNLSKLYIVGHSAGGHLALWLGKNGNGITTKPLILVPSALIGLAPVTDLITAYQDTERREFIRALMNGKTPDEARSDYLKASPLSLLPNAVEQLIIHGDADALIPIRESEIYTRLADAAGDKATLLRIQGGYHMDFTEPNSISSQTLTRWLMQRTN